MSHSLIISTLWLPVFLLMLSFMELDMRLTSLQAELGKRLVTAILPWRLMVQDTALAHSLQVLIWWRCNPEHDFRFISTLTKGSSLWLMLSCLTSSMLSSNTSVVWSIITLSR